MLGCSSASVSEVSAREMKKRRFALPGGKAAWCGAEPHYTSSETVLGDGSLVRRRSIPVGIGEDVFPVRLRRDWGDAANDKKDRPEGWRCRWANDIVRVLTKCAIRVARTIWVEVRDLDRGAKDQ